MTAFMAGGVGADACSVLLACSGEARALTGSSNCRPAGRSGAEYNGSEFARAVGLPVIACSADGALLTTISSKWRVLHAEPCLLPPQSSGLQLGSEGLSCQDSWLQEGQGWVLHPEPAGGLCVVSHPLLTPSTSWKTKARA